MEKLFEIASRMDPEEAVTQVSKLLKSLLSNLDEEASSRFLLDLIGNSQDDKIASMVHL